MHGYHKPTTLMKVQHDNGELAKNNIENAQIFKKHFQKLFNNNTTTKFDPDVLKELTPIPESKPVGYTPTLHDIRLALI